jgi:hypothetical protein
VANGANPLEVVVRDYFAIGQSTPLAGSDNVITVTLIFRVPLAAGDTVTISGLTGTQTADAIGSNGLILNDASGVGNDDHLKFSTVSPKEVGRGDWVKTSGTLTMECMGAVAALTELRFNFTVTNPEAAQESPDMSIAATLAAGNVAQVAMTKPGTSTLVEGDIVEGDIVEGDVSRAPSTTTTSTTTTTTTGERV